MSPRAAWRLEHLGFGEVYDYVAGKMDWLGRGNDYAGSADLIVRHLDRAVPRCSPSTPVAEVRRTVDTAGICVVVNGSGVVFGIVDAGTLEAAGREGDAAGDVMRPGISTVRPSEEREKLDGRLAERKIRRAVVTDPEGRLLGVYMPR